MEACRYRACKSTARSIALLIMTIPYNASAQSLIGTLLSEIVRPKPIGQNPNAHPPMDQPALDWFTYNHDDLGRPTYLSTECLRTARDRMAQCVVSEDFTHRALIEQHDEQARKIAYEAAQKAEADRRERERAEAKARAEAATRLERQPTRAPTLQDLVAEIRSTKRSLANGQRMLARENEVAEVSGATDYNTRYMIGQQIVYLRGILIRQYSSYRKAGGKLPLSQI